MGLENWCMAFYDQPHLVKRMIANRVKFAKDLLPRLLHETGAPVASSSRGKRSLANCTRSAIMRLTRCG